MPDPQEGVFLRIYNPVVKYIEDQLLEADAVYIPGEEVVFTVVEQRPSNWGGQSSSELSWVYPEEVRFLASIALSVPEGLGTISFAPNGVQVRLNIDREDLTDTKLLHKIGQQAIQIARKTYGDEVRYGLRSAKTSGEVYQRELYKGMDTGDALLIRSLSCLLRSKHLMAIDCYAF